MGRVPTTSNICDPGMSRPIVHYNDGTGKPRCGAPLIGTQKWTKDGGHVNCPTCNAIKKRTQAVTGVIPAGRVRGTIPEQPKRATGIVVGTGPTFIQPPPAPPIDEIDDEDDSDRHVPTPVRDPRRKARHATPVAVAGPAPTPVAAEPEETTEMTAQPSAADAGQAATPTAPAVPAPDQRPSNSTSPMILDLGDLIDVEQTAPTFQAAFTAENQPKVGCEHCGGPRDPELVVVVTADGKHAALAKAIKDLTFVLTEQTTQSWMGGGNTGSPTVA